MGFEELVERINKIVSICSSRHIGGESYFDELDCMVKNDVDLVSAYVNYIVQKEKVPNIIVSGEIRRLIRHYQHRGYIYPFINIVSVNGGLRRDRDVEEINTVDIICNKFIFLDDSYYSGKTARKVKAAVEDNGGEIVRTYGFYDGSPEKRDDVVSLYIYYK